MVFVELEEGCDRLGQKDFFSGGDGYGRLAGAQRNYRFSKAYRKIDAAIVHNYNPRRMN